MCPCASDLSWKPTPSPHFDHFYCLYIQQHSLCLRILCVSSWTLFLINMLFVFGWFGSAFVSSSSTMVRFIVVGFVCFWDIVSLCSITWLWTHNELPAPVSQVLGLQASGISPCTPRYYLVISSLRSQSPLASFLIILHNPAALHLTSSPSEAFGSFFMRLGISEAFYSYIFHVEGKYKIKWGDCFSVWSSIVRLYFSVTCSWFYVSRITIYHCNHSFNWVFPSHCIVKREILLVTTASSDPTIHQSWTSTFDLKYLLFYQCLTQNILYC